MPKAIKTVTYHLSFFRFFAFNVCVSCAALGAHRHKKLIGMTLLTVIMSVANHIVPHVAIFAMVARTAEMMVEPILGNIIDRIVREEQGEN